jgi:type IX secretion system PorP/SprF family membrane protein
MKALKTILMIILLSLGSNGLKAQQASFSQFYASSLFLNPALVGNFETLALNSAFRSQWATAVSPYITTQVSLIAPLRSRGFRKKHYGGAGLTFYKDRAGDGNFTTNLVMGSFAYNFALDRKKLRVLSLGGQLGVVQKNFDFTSLEFGSQFNPQVGFDPNIDPGETNWKNNVIYPVFNIGIVFYYNPKQSYLFTGMSAFHGLVISNVNRPNESFIDGETSRVPFLIKYHGGFEIHLNSKSDISPNILIQYQGGLMEVNGGLYYTYRMFDTPLGILAKTDLVIGGWYRFGDAAILSVGLDNQFYTLGFSYDFNANSFYRVTGGLGAYEVTLTLRQAKEKKRRRFSTPKI